MISLKKKTSKTELICPNCGTVTSIQRKNSRLKRLYHLKYLYCYKCQIVTNQIEIKDKDVVEKELVNKTHLTKDDLKVLSLIRKG